jgi:hypothetical protein
MKQTVMIIYKFHDCFKRSQSFVIRERNNPNFRLFFRQPSEAKFMAGLSKKHPDITPNKPWY